MAGVLGIDPRPLTLRQLLAMHEGRRREAWYHTALVASILAEAYRDRDARSQPYTELDFHPEGPEAYRDADRPAPPPTRTQIETLETLFPAK